MTSAKVAYKDSITNQPQGGGNTQMGLYPRGTSSTAFSNATKNVTMTLNGTQTLLPHQRNVSPLAGMFFTSSMGVDHW